MLLSYQKKKQSRSFFHMSTHSADNIRVHAALMQEYLSLYNSNTQERDKQAQNFSLLQ